MDRAVIRAMAPDTGIDTSSTSCVVGVALKLATKFRARRFRSFTKGIL